MFWAAAEAGRLGGDVSMPGRSVGESGGAVFAPLVDGGLRGPPGKYCTHTVRCMAR